MQKGVGGIWRFEFLFFFGRWHLSDLLAKPNLFSLRSEYLMTSKVGIQNKEVIIEPIALGDKVEQPFIKQT